MNHKKTTNHTTKRVPRTTPGTRLFLACVITLSFLSASAYSFSIGAAVTMQSEMNLLIFPPASIISRFASGVAQNVIFSAPVGLRPAPGRKPPHFVLFSSVIVAQSLILVFFFRSERVNLSYIMQFEESAFLSVKFNVREVLRL